MSSSPADRSRPPLAHTVRRLLPARSVIGFIALLTALFALSYAAGAVAGPVAPGLHPAGGTRTGGSTPADDGDMGGMHGMGAGAPRPVPVGASR
ncbi:hypothetical protein DY245_07665 [Streptomyces inhibens]|uniref:Uncharacterized protein n=1 Tax=Streptomyces inhibens TaxID=2293571 RepID=A0A371Q846_STRIH|nr:hypothetical protein [Streptomyces inhibens]REK90855.1 hypothetical protein DY245_07665 [Streptomyces inhibens]